jgi:hypothetical protein
MDEPTRLLDDPTAPPGLKEDLRAASEIAPQSYDGERGLDRLRTALMAGTAGAAAATSATASAGAKAGLAWTALALAAAAGMGGALYLAVGSPAPGPAPEEPGQEQAPASAVPAAQEASEPPAVEPTAPEPAAAPVAEATPAVEEAPSPPTRRTHRAPEPGSMVETPGATAEPVADDPDEQLRAEIGQLARIRSQLESDPAQALALAREGQRRFAGGMFGEERAALVVFALDRLDRRAEAERQARRFIAAHPVGPFTSRVRAVLERD